MYDSFRYDLEDLSSNSWKQIGTQRFSFSKAEISVGSYLF